MNAVQRHHYIAISLLVAVLYLAPAVSRAQSTTESGSPTTAILRSDNTREVSSQQERNGNSVRVSIDPFAVLPASDALLTLDVKRVISEALPRLLSGDPDMRVLVITLADLKKLAGLDPRAVQRVVMGIRYTNAQAGTSQPNFHAVVIAQSSEAGQLPTLMRQMGPGKFLEQQYAEKILYIAQPDKTEPKIESTALPIKDGADWAIAALDTNTIVFGDAAYVRSSIDVSAGKGIRVNAELVAAVKRSPKALLSAAGLLPPSLMSASQRLVNSEMSRTLSSLKRFNASIELTPTGFDVGVILNTDSSEQAKTIADVVAAFKTLTSSLAPGKTRQDKVIRDLVKSLVVSAGGTEVQVRDEITQASVNELAKQFAAEIYISRGLAQMDKGDPEAAIADYDKAIMLNPESVIAFINRGKARSDKGTLDAAIADYDMAISLYPDAGLAYNNRCFVRIRKGDFDAAIVDCDKAIALDPTDAFAYNNRGFAFAGQGNLVKAVADYDKSIALNAENAFAYRNRGNARNQNGDWDGAIADFDKAITINDKSAEAYTGRATARYYKGELDQAIADCDKAIALDPKSAIAYNNRGLALVEKGDLDKAIADYDMSIAIDAKNDFAYQNRGDLRVQKGDWDGAIADFDKAISLNPKSAVSYNGRGLARFFKGELDQAIADYNTAIALDPNPAIYTNRGRARSQKKDWDGAIADFDKAISLNPKLPEAFNGRGLARYDKGELDQAIADYDRAIALDPDSAEYYGNRALSRLALRMDAEAEQDLKKCFELDESLRPIFEASVKEVRKNRRTKPRNHH